MLVSYGRTWYLFIVIPSALSIVSCLLLVGRVLGSASLRTRIYHRLSAALAVTQIIMFSSWMMGNKYDAPIAICKAQDYIFQTGQLSGTATITIVNSYVFYVLYMTTLPSEKVFNYCYASIMALCVVFMIVAIGADTAALFCGNDQSSPFSSDNFDHGSRVKKITMKCTYLYPLILMLVINVAFSCYCVSQLVIFQKGNNILRPLLVRLFTFTIVVLICGLPKMISFFFFENHDLLANIGNSFVHLSGVFLSAAYFYYTVFEDNRRMREQYIRNSILGKDVRLSSTPEGAYCDSEYTRNSDSTLKSIDMQSLHRTQSTGVS